MSLAKLNNEIYLNCELCKHNSNCLNIPQPGFFVENTKVLFIAQNPGYPRFENKIENDLIQAKKTDWTNIENLYKHMILDNTKMGTFIYDIFSKILNIQTELSFTNAAKCACANNFICSNILVKNCKQYLKSQIQYTNPQIIVSCGKVASRIIDELNLNFKHLNIYHYSYFERGSKLYRDGAIRELQQKLREVLKC